MQESVISANGPTFSINPTEAIISGTTYPIGSEATVPMTAVINGQTVSLGPSGVGLRTTTVPVPEPTGERQESIITVDGLTFAVNPTEAIISGTTYPIGSEATSPTTTIINGQTVSLGSNGVGLPTTTVTPPSTSPSSTRTETGDVQPFTGGAVENTLGAARIVGIIMALGLEGLIFL